MSDQTPEEPDGPPPPRPFTQFALEQRKGGMHVQLSEALRDGVAASMDLGKVSTITLQLKITPSKDGETVSISDAVKTKFPEPDAVPSTYFVDPHGNVSRSNPAQTELPLREVAAAESGAVRVVGGAS